MSRSPISLACLTMKGMKSGPPPAQKLSDQRGQPFTSAAGSRLGDSKCRRVQVDGRRELQRMQRSTGRRMQAFVRSRSRFWEIAPEQDRVALPSPARLGSWRPHASPACKAVRSRCSAVSVQVSCA